MFCSVWLFFIQMWSLFQINYSPVILHLSPPTGTFNENTDLGIQWYNLLKHPWFQFQALKCITQKRVQWLLFCINFCINFNQHVKIIWFFADPIQLQKLCLWCAQSHCKFLKLKKKTKWISMCSQKHVWDISFVVYIVLLQCTISNLSIKFSSLIHSQRNNRGSYSQVSAFWTQQGRIWLR